MTDNDSSEETMFHTRFILEEFTHENQFARSSLSVLRDIKQNIVLPTNETVCFSILFINWACRELRRTPLLSDIFM